MRPLTRLKSNYDFAAGKIGTVAMLVVIAGIVLRIAGWLGGRNLWLDEVRIAANIIDRSWSGLLSPLEFAQSAPVLFLISVKACVSVFGLSEQPFRLVPLLASLAQLLIFWRLSSRILPPLAGLIAIAFCAFSERLLYYAQELKQYSTESLVTTLLIYLALRWFDEPENKRARWLLAGAGTVCILFSHTAVFALCGVMGAALALPAAKRSLLFIPKNFLLFGLCWGPLFLANYHWVIAGNFQDEVMINYWANTYPGVPFDAAGLAHWTGLLAELIRYHELPWRTTQALIILAVPGLFWLLRKRDVPLLIVLFPIALYWAAGMVHKAPFFGRLVIFLHPVIILGFVLSLAESCRLGVRLRLEKIMAVGCLLLGLYVLGKQFTALPKATDPNLVVEALTRVKRDARPGDVVYVSSPAVPTHRVYAKTMPYPSGLTVVEGRRIVNWQSAPLQPAMGLVDRDAFIADLKQLNPEAKRIWLVLNRFRHLRDKVPSDLKAIWSVDPLLIWQGENTELYLVELSHPSR